MNELKRLFQVKVPAIATYDDYDIYVDGKNMSNVNGKFVDLSTSLEVVVYYNLLDMMEAVRKGFGVKMVNSEDVINIHKIIEGYLEHLTYANHGLNARVVTKDVDILELNNFADSIFKLNKHAITDDAYQRTKFNPFNKNFNLINRNEVSRVSVSNNRYANNDNVEDLDTVYEGRYSYPSHNTYGAHNTPTPNQVYDSATRKNDKIIKQTIYEKEIL